MRSWEEKPGNHPYINIQLIQHSREVRRVEQNFGGRERSKLSGFLSATAASGIIHGLFVFTRGRNVVQAASSGAAPGSRRGPDKRINADYR